MCACARAHVCACVCVCVCAHEAFFGAHMCFVCVCMYVCVLMRPSSSQGSLVSLYGAKSLYMRVYVCAHEAFFEKAAL